MELLSKMNLPKAVASDQVGVLTLHLDGMWFVNDFSHFLSHTAAAYESLNKFLFVTERQKGEDGISREQMCHGSEDFGELLSAMRFQDYEVPLTITQIHLASPGIAEVMGNLSPLNVMADFITAWRHGNTERGHRVTRDQLDEFVARTDTLKFLSDRAAQLTTKGEPRIIETFLTETLLNPQFNLVMISDYAQLKAIEVNKYSR
jgi:hypothetical protein